MTKTLLELIQTRTRPQAETRLEVWYAEEPGHDNVMLHEKTCGQHNDVLKRMKIRLGELPHTFKSENIWACVHCYRPNWTLAWLLLQEHTGKPAGLPGQLDGALRLETVRQDQWQQWVHWLYGKNIEDLQEAGKQLYGWNDEEPKLFCVDINYLGLAWLGEHYCAEFGVHGLVPVSLKTYLGEAGVGPQIEVGEHFDRNHFKLAVQLYENAKSQARGYDKEQPLWLQAQAQAAAETAKLCLR